MCVCFCFVLACEAFYLSVKDYNAATPPPPPRASNNVPNIQSEEFWLRVQLCKVCPEKCRGFSLLLAPHRSWSLTDFDCFTPPPKKKEKKKKNLSTSCKAGGGGGDGARDLSSPPPPKKKYWSCTHKIMLLGRLLQEYCSSLFTRGPPPQKKKKKKKYIYIYIYIYTYLFRCGPFRYQWFPAQEQYVEP